MPLKCTSNLLKVIVISLTIAPCGCNLYPPPTKKDAVGTFQGNLGGTEQVLTLNPDSTFIQILTQKGKPPFTNQGTWRIEGHEIVFENFLKDCNIGVKSIRGEQLLTDNVRGYWITSGKITNIVFDVDEGYQLQKTSSINKN